MHTFSYSALLIYLSVWRLWRGYTQWLCWWFLVHVSWAVRPVAQSVPLCVCTYCSCDKYMYLLSDEELDLVWVHIIYVIKFMNVHLYSSWLCGTQCIRHIFCTSTEGWEIYYLVCLSHWWELTSCWLHFFCLVPSSKNQTPEHYLNCQLCSIWRRSHMIYKKL